MTQAPSGTPALRNPAKNAVCGVTMAAENKDGAVSRRAALGLVPALAGLAFSQVSPWTLYTLHPKLAPSHGKICISSVRSVQTGNSLVQ